MSPIRAPVFANSRTVARPTPAEAPVTTTTRRALALFIVMARNGQQGECQRAFPLPTSSPLLFRAHIERTGTPARIFTGREDLCLLHFLGAGGRQRVDEEHPAGSFVIGELVQAPLEQPLR